MNAGKTLFAQLMEFLPSWVGTRIGPRPGRLVRAARRPRPLSFESRRHRVQAVQVRFVEVKDARLGPGSLEILGPDGF